MVRGGGGSNPVSSGQTESDPSRAANGRVFLIQFFFLPLENACPTRTRTRGTLPLSCAPRLRITRTIRVDRSLHTHTHTQDVTFIYIYIASKCACPSVREGKISMVRVSDFVFTEFFRPVGYSSVCVRPT